MPTFRVIGRVASLDRPDQPDEFGYVISASGLDISEVPIPLLFLRETESSYLNTEVVGRLTRLTLTDDGQVEVEGTTEMLDPGCYACGVDLDRIVMLKPEGDGAPVVFAKSRLRSVIAYAPGMDLVGSFTNAHLHVEQPETRWFCEVCFADGDGERPVPCPSCWQDETYSSDPASD